MPVNNWPEWLAEIPCIQQAGLLDWQPLIHPGNNQLAVVNTGQGRWLVRSNHDLPGVDRVFEQQLLQQLQNQPWVPRLIAADPEVGYLVTSYLDAMTWRRADYSDPNKVKVLADQLNTLHQMPCEQTHTRLDNRLQHYLCQIPVSADLRQRIQLTVSQLEKLRFWDACRQVYHSDLNPGNLLGSDPVYLIDWEFAGQGHGILDWLIMEHESGCDLSAWYPASTETPWLSPLRQLINDLMKLWQPLTHK